MKINQLPILLSLLAFIFTLVSCKTGLDSSGSTLQTVQVRNNQTTKSLSDFFTIDGHTKIEKTDQHPVRSIVDVLFSGNDLFILDGATDFQNIWAFDIQGNYLGTIGHYNESQPEGYAGLNDFCLSRNGEEIIALDAGKLSFKQYDRQGNLQKNLPNGMYGENVELLDDGSYVVYNEYGASEISGLHHLLIFDREGNLVKRMYPYASNQEGMAYQFTGFLTRSSNELWFSPPFSDTVYSVQKSRITPEYVFDFGENAIPEPMRSGKLDGWAADPYSYLTASFVKTGKLTIFEYFANQRVNLGIYDDISGAFLGFNDARSDAFSELLRVGKIYPKDANSFAFVLNDLRIRYLVQKNKLDVAYLEQHHPALLADLRDAVSKPGTSIILHLGIKQGAMVQR